MFAPPFGHPLSTQSPAPITAPPASAAVFGSMMEFSSPFASPMKPPGTPGGAASFAVGLASSPMVVQSPARHETPKKLVATMPTSKNARRQRLMETCLRKVKDNRNTLVSTLRAGGLTPASFRSEIGRMVNYEWNTMDNGAGVAPLSSAGAGMMMREDELEEAEYAETIIALEQAFLDDLRREEQGLVDQYFDEVRRFEEEQIRDAIERYVPEEEGEEAVWCPICKRGQLKQSHRIMFCSYQPCGLRLDTKQDEVDLSYVRQRLGEAIMQHSQRCDACPGFALRQEPFSNTVMLCMACPACNSLYVIL